MTSALISPCRYSRVTPVFFSLKGPPVDPDEDSDNSAIYVQGLNDNVTLDDLADFFKQCGVVKVSTSKTV